MVGYSYPWKLIPSKFNPRIVTMEICRFMVYGLLQARHYDT